MRELPRTQHTSSRTSLRRQVKTLMEERQRTLAAGTDGGDNLTNHGLAARSAGLSATHGQEALIGLESNLQPAD